MGLFDNWYNKEPKKEIAKDDQPRAGAVLFFSVLWQQFWEICKLNLLLILFSLPLITIPTTLVASNKVLAFMLMDKPLYTFETFFDTFKKEWKKASIVGLIYFPFLLLSFFAMYFYSQVYDNFFFYCVAMLSSAALLIVGFYLFTMVAVIELKIKDIFKNALLMTFLCMPQNVLTLLIIVGLTLLVVLFLPPTITIVILIFFALIDYLAVFCAYNGLRKYIIKKEEINE